MKALILDCTLKLSPESSNTPALGRRGRLRRSDCTTEGIARLGAGRGFTYRDADGGRVSDEETLTRIRELAIPPAWREVWICPDPLGHLQATGIDAAGRKQYLYHERWQRRRAERKFQDAREFAAALPRLRRAVTADLRRQGIPRERALACAVRLLDLGFFRVGGEVYAEENESFGLATVRREHVSIKSGEVVFDFPAKSGQQRVQSINDPAARRAIETMHRRRSGPEDLLAWRDRDGWHDVQSADINSYIQEQIGERLADRRTLLGQGLSYLAWDGAGRGRTGRRATAELSSGRKAGDKGRRHAGRRGIRQHPGGLPPFLHRPARDRAFRRRRDDQPEDDAQRPGERTGPERNRASGPVPGLLNRCADYERLTGPRAAATRLPSRDTSRRHHSGLG